jgi:hypothetical protein
MHAGPFVPTHGAVAVLVTFPPHALVPIAVTRLATVPHRALTVVLYADALPGSNL